MAAPALLQRYAAECRFEIAHNPRCVEQRKLEKVQGLF